MSSGRNHPAWAVTPKRTFRSVRVAACHSLQPEGRTNLVIPPCSRGRTTARIAFLISFCLLVSLIPSVPFAYAEEPGESESQPVEVPPSDVTVTAPEAVLSGEPETVDPERSLVPLPEEATPAQIIAPLDEVPTERTQDMRVYEDPEGGEHIYQVFEAPVNYWDVSAGARSM